MITTYLTYNKWTDNETCERTHLDHHNLTPEQIQEAIDNYAERKDGKQCDVSQDGAYFTKIIAKQGKRKDCIGIDTLGNPMEV